MRGHWSDTYLGLPYDECNCAALVNRVVAAEFGFDPAIPDSAPSRSAATRRIETERGLYGIPTTAPLEGDAVLLRQGERVKHIGIYCELAGVPHVLHAVRSHGAACRHPLRDLGRLGFEIEGFYAWPQR